MALTFTVVKRFRPHAGVRRGLMDITFDSSGPTWVVTAVNFKLPKKLWDLRLPAHVDGFVLGFVAATLTIDARQEESVAAGGGLVAAGAADLNTKVVRAEYIGF